MIKSSASQSQNRKAQKDDNCLNARYTRKGTKLRTVLYRAKELSSKGGKKREREEVEKKEETEIDLYL